MSEHEDLPVVSDDSSFLKAAGLENMKMSTGLAIFMKPSLYSHCKSVALRMSEANGVIGPHLIGQPSACMAILSRAITWNLDPFAVAQCTYAVKGKVGYEGKLVQAILENSGQLEGPIKYEFFGDWDKLRGKFKMVGAVGSGERKPQQLWTDDDEAGLGLRVSAQVKGEATRREEEFFLAEMWPRNSTLWIIRPKQQMIYASIRAFSNIAVPGILMGIPFDVDPSGLGESGEMRDITPVAPKRSEFTRDVRTDAALQEWIARANHADTIDDITSTQAKGLQVVPPDHHARFIEVCEARAAAIKAAAERQETTEVLATEETSQDTGQPVEDQSQAEPEPVDEGPSDNDLIHEWGDKLAACKEVKEVADLRAQGLKELPERLHARWDEGCNARSKAIADKPRTTKAAAKPAGTTKAAAEPAPVKKAGVKSEPLERGRRLLAGKFIKTADDVADLEESIASELSGDALEEWHQDCKVRKEALAA